jgi:hypothetical protein
MATDVTRGSGTTSGARSASRNFAGRRLTTETKAGPKTTEFLAWLLLTAGVLIAGLVTKAGDDGGVDRLPANDAWLFASIITAAYIVSRGLAKSGSSEPYFEDGTNAERGDRFDR